MNSKFKKRRDNPGSQHEDEEGMSSGTFLTLIKGGVVVILHSISSVNCMNDGGRAPSSGVIENIPQADVPVTRDVFKKN